MMYGTNIVSVDDILSKVGEEYLYNSLISPKPQTAAAMNQLRTVYSLDSKKYSELKRRLPYVVCGSFNPPFRNSANFAYTNSFILDFDLLSAKGLRLDDVREKIQGDSRVAMCFCSPSGDGLKVLFHLSEKCFDKGVYTLFYKAFASSFAASFGLEQVVDSRTSDVARACFISVDPKAYYCPSADSVDLKAFVDIDNPTAVFDLRRELKAVEAEAPKEEKSQEPSEPDKDVMAAIRQKLNPKATLKPKEVFVPERLNQVIRPLTNYIQSLGITVIEVVNIQYAKKIRASIGGKEAEVNLFYGGRGFSVIISPRRGTDPEANELLQLTIVNFLSENRQ